MKVTDVYVDVIESDNRRILRVICRIDGVLFAQAIFL